MKDGEKYAVWVKDLTRRFGKDFLAVDRVGFSVLPGEVFGYDGYGERVSPLVAAPSSWVDDYSAHHSCS